MVGTISTVGRDDDEIARMLSQKTNNALRRILPVEGNVIDFESELDQRFGWRISLF